MDCNLQLITIYIMQNRWGQTLEPKPPSRNSSSNNINININFNNVKEKTNVFAGKKLNNFVEVSNDPKTNISRPNVSMETLKQKKKVTIIKEQPNQPIKRKKSKSKIINELCTPQKRRNRHFDDEKSANKTNNRQSKSHQNLKMWHKRKKSKSKSKSNSNSKFESKSRSKSQSSQKLIKNFSKKKFSQNHKVQTKPKNVEERQSNKKVKKPKVDNIDMKQSTNDTKPNFSQRYPKKEKKFSETKPKPKKTKRNKSPQKDKELKRPPLVYEVDDHDFDEETELKNHKKQVQKVLYEDKIESQEQDDMVKRYVNGQHTYDDFKKLTKVAETIQRFWKGFKIRTQFLKELQLMNQKIKMARQKIDQSDPKYWGEEDSIMKIEDQESLKSLSIKMSGHSISEKHDDEKEIDSERPMSGKKQNIQIQDKLTRLQADLLQERQKYEKLEEENRNLKSELQKVSNQQSFNSIEQNLWEEEKKSEEDPTDMVILKLPKKIKKQNVEEPQKPIKKPALEIEVKSPIESEHIQQIRSYGGDFRSPKSLIDQNYAALFKQKESEVKNNFQKKANMYERMLHDRLFSPRTYNVKKTQLQEKFKQQTQLIRTRLEEASRVVSFFRELKEEEKKEVVRDEPEEIPHNQPLTRQTQQKQIDFMQNENEKKEKHKVEEYPNISINSFRDEEDRKQESVEVSEESDPKEIQSEQKAKDIYKNIVESEKPKEEEQIREQILEVERVVGMETTLHFIKQYCIALIEYIRNSIQFRDQFMKNIITPIRYDQLEFLKTYRTTLQSDNDSSYNSLKKEFMYPFFKIIYPHTNIISRESFEQFNQSYEKLQGECNYPTEREYFLNSILDAFNQALDYERPSSVYGESPIWSIESKALKNHNITFLDPILSMESSRLDEACGVAIARLIQWATSLCGFIPESPEMQNIVIEEQQIQTIRETRMALMLERGLVEDEEKMIDMKIEDTEINLQVGEIIMEMLVDEFIMQRML